jgi:hypothetical protein
MRLRPLTLFVCFLFFVVSHAIAEISFTRVWPNWVDADAFETISEYFSGHEHTGKRVIHRSQPDARAGFYFLARVANTGAEITHAKFTLHVIMPGNPEPKTFTFPASLPARSTVFQLGLTGADWPDREIHPVAWKLDLLSATDELLATEQSFLWSKPAK